MLFLNSEHIDLDSANEWIGSQPENLENGVSIVYFWNYGCRCCRDRVKFFDKLNEVYDKVNVIGVHTPNFVFEKDFENLKRTLQDLDLTHSITHDAESNVFQKNELAYSNHSVILENGTIVYQSYGRNQLDKVEKKISDLLSVRKEGISRDQYNSVVNEFLGYSRCDGLNEEGNSPGRNNFELKPYRSREKVHLKGGWIQREEFIESTQDSELYYNFESTEFSIVVDPKDGIRDIRVLLDGEPVSEDIAGNDLRIEDGKSYVRVKNPGLYNLFNSEQQQAEITLIPDKNTKIYALNFLKPEV